MRRKHLVVGIVLLSGLLIPLTAKAAFTVFTQRTYFSLKTVVIPRAEVAVHEIEEGLGLDESATRSSLSKESTSGSIVTEASHWQIAESSTKN